MSVCVVRRHFGSRGVFSGPRIALAWSPLFLLCMHGALLGLCYGALTWARYRLERSSATLVSSSGVFVRGAEHWSVYMQDVLQAVYERTGQRCILVARGGLAFCNHRDPSWTYHHVLQRITARCEAPRSWYGRPWGRISAHLGPTCGRMSLGCSAPWGHFSPRLSRIALSIASCMGGPVRCGSTPSTSTQGRVASMIVYAV